MNIRIIWVSGLLAVVTVFFAPLVSQAQWPKPTVKKIAPAPVSPVPKIISNQGKQTDLQYIQSLFKPFPTRLASKAEFISTDSFCAAGFNPQSSFVDVISAYIQRDFKSYLKGLLSLENNLTCLDARTINQLQLAIAASLSSAINSCGSGNNSVACKTLSGLVNPSLIVADMLRFRGSIFTALETNKNIVTKAIVDFFPAEVGLWGFDLNSGKMIGRNLWCNQEGNRCKAFMELFAERFFDRTNHGVGCPMADMILADFMCGDGVDCEANGGLGGVMENGVDAIAVTEGGAGAPPRDVTESFVSPLGVSGGNILDRFCGQGRSANRTGSSGSGGRQKPGGGGSNQGNSTFGYHNCSATLDLREAATTVLDEAAQRGACLARYSPLSNYVRDMRHELGMDFRSGAGARDPRCGVMDDDGEGVQSTTNPPETQNVSDAKQDQLNKEREKAREAMKQDQELREKVAQATGRTIDQNQWNQMVDEAFAVTVVGVGEPQDSGGFGCASASANGCVKEHSETVYGPNGPTTEAAYTVLLNPRYAEQNTVNGVSLSEAVYHEMTHLVMDMAGVERTAQITDQHREGTLHNWIRTHANTYVLTSSVYTGGRGGGRGYDPDSDNSGCSAANRQMEERMACVDSFAGRNVSYGSQSREPMGTDVGGNVINPNPMSDSSGPACSAEEALAGMSAHSGALDCGEDRYSGSAMLANTCARGAFSTVWDARETVFKKRDQHCDPRPGQESCDPLRNTEGGITPFSGGGGPAPESPHSPSPEANVPSPGGTHSDPQQSPAP